MRFLLNFNNINMKQVNYKFSSVKIFEILFVSFLVFLTVFFATLIIENYNVATFLYDGTLFVNVADNLRTGNGFSLNLVLATTEVSPESGYYHKNISADAIIKENPDLISPYGKPPLFFILEAGFFEVFSANSSNWIFVSTVLSVLISICFIVLYYYFCRKYFGILGAVFSSLLIVTSTILIILTPVAKMHILAFMFIIISFLFLEKQKSHYLLFGIFSALASLTHPLGIMSLAGYSSFLLFKREMKGFLIVISAWSVLLLPWMIRQYFTYNDFGFLLGIPLSRQISSIFSSSKVELLEPSIDYSSSLIASPFELLHILFIERDYNSEFIVLFIYFSVFFFFSVFNIKKSLNKKNSILTAGVFSGISIIVFIYLQFIEINSIYFATNHIIQLGIIVLVPLFFVCLSIRSKWKIFFDTIKRPHLVLVFFGVASIFAIYFSSLIALQLNHFIAFPILFMILPLGIVGFKNLIENLPYKLKRYKNFISIGIIAVIILSASFIVVPKTVNFANGYGNVEKTTGAPSDVLYWLANSVESDTVLMYQFPTVLFMQTGNPVIVTPSEISNDLETFDYYASYYGADYLVVNVNMLIKNLDLLLILYGYQNVYENDHGWRIIKLLDTQIVECDLNELNLIQSLVDSQAYDDALIRYDHCGRSLNIEPLVGKLNVYKILNQESDIKKMYNLINAVLTAKIEMLEDPILKEKFEKELYASFKSEIDWWKNIGNYYYLLNISNDLLTYDKFNTDALYGRAEAWEKMGLDEQAVNDYNLLLNFVSEEEKIEVMKRIESIIAKNLRIIDD